MLELLTGCGCGKLSYNGRPCKRTYRNPDERQTDRLSAFLPDLVGGGVLVGIGLPRYPNQPGVTMTKKQVFDHFGGARKVAETLGIATASVYQWGDRVPLLRQYQIEKMTKGKLKAAKQ
jgi:hypothetical protein